LGQLIIALTPFFSVRLTDSVWSVRKSRPEVVQKTMFHYTEIIEKTLARLLRTYGFDAFRRHHAARSADKPLLRIKGGHNLG